MDKKSLVLEFIKERGSVYSYELISYFTQHYCISADRLARFLVAEGKLGRREPTEREKLYRRLKARTVIYFIPKGQGYLNFGNGL